MAENRIISMWEHTGWGNQIFFIDWEKRKVSGHMFNIPKVGDILRARMDSGKIARFEFTEVKQMRDPKDQFFATVRDLNYE